MARRRGYQWLGPVWNYLLITGGVGQAERRRAELQERCLNQNWPADVVRFRAAAVAPSAYFETKLTPLRRRYGQVFVSSLRLGAVSSNEHEARVNIDVELFFIARNRRMLPSF